MPCWLIVVIILAVIVVFGLLWWYGIGYYAPVNDRSGLMYPVTPHHDEGDVVEEPDYFRCINNRIPGPRNSPKRRRNLDR